ETPVAQLGEPISALYKRSLLLIRTQVDHDGAILAANDSDVLDYNRDTYSYMWPRDGALVADALDRAGQPYLARGFYRFCADGLPKPSYDLWEERHGVHAFTVGSVWAGLQAAAQFSELFGYEERAKRLRDAAVRMRRRAREAFFDPQLGRYVRRLYRTNGSR